jgi:hypothetical protein
VEIVAFLLQPGAELFNYDPEPTFMILPGFGFARVAFGAVSPPNRSERVTSPAILKSSTFRFAVAGRSLLVEITRANVATAGA